MQNDAERGLMQVNRVFFLYFALQMLYMHNVTIINKYLPADFLNHVMWLRIFEL